MILKGASTIEKKVQIEKIISSNSFKKSTTSTALLRYLYKTQEEGIQLKESIIAIEFFGKDESSNNNIVRVSIYNLRNQLNKYYENEGKDDDWKISIEKGQYKLSFITNKMVTKKPPLSKKSLVLPYLLFTIALVFIIIIKFPKQKPKLWEDFIKNDNINLYIGDLWGFEGKIINGEDGHTRDYDINSIEEYYSMLEKKPELKDITKPSTYINTSSMGSISTNRLSYFMAQFNKKINIKYTSKSNYSEFIKNNSILIGPTRSGKAFLTAFNDVNPNIRLYADSLKIKSNKYKKAQTINLWKTGGINADYAIVSRAQSPQGSELFFFYSNHDIGVNATIEYFTNTDSIKAFTERYLGENKHFTALFKVRGHEREHIKIETVFVDNL